MSITKPLIKLVDNMNIQQQIRQEIIDCLDYEEYSAFGDLKVTHPKYRSEGEYEVSFTVNDIELTVYVRKEGNTFEINTYEDNWEEFNSYSWEAKNFWAMLLFQAVSEVTKLQRKVCHHG